MPDSRSFGLHSVCRDASSAKHSASDNMAASKTWGPLFGNPVIRIIVYWSLLLGSPFMETPVSVQATDAAIITVQISM